MVSAQSCGVHAKSEKCTFVNKPKSRSAEGEIFSLFFCFQFFPVLNGCALLCAEIKAIKPIGNESPPPRRGQRGKAGARYGLPLARPLRFAPRSSATVCPALWRFALAGSPPPRGFALARPLLFCLPHPRAGGLQTEAFPQPVDISENRKSKVFRFGFGAKPRKSIA